MVWGPSVSVMPREFARCCTAVACLSGGSSATSVASRMHDRSRSLKVGWSLSAFAMWGQPSTWVTRSFSMRSSVAPGSNCSSKTSVAPACMAAMSV
jgi:hypothetical protein